MRGPFFPHGSLSLGWPPGPPPSMLHAAAARASSSAAGDATPPQEEEHGRGRGAGKPHRFSREAATTSGVLALIGDAAAQLRSQRRSRRRDPALQNAPPAPSCEVKAMLRDYDWLRALRMGSYGFLIYGPGSQIWYGFLDHLFPGATLRNLFIKVTLNQLVLGPCVIAVVFAWNSLWQGRVDKLLDLYYCQAVPTLVDGWKFWIPASVLNFGVVPLQARVAFMSSCSMFWNFYLSTTVSE